MKTQIIEIKTGSTPINQIVEAVQGDSGRVLRCIISDMSIPAGSTARFYAVKPSGAEIYNDCAIDGQAVVLNMNTQMLAEVGTLNGQIEVTNSGKTVTSFSFCVNVIKNIKSNSAIESSNEFTALEEALRKAEEVADPLINFEEAAEREMLTTGERLSVLVGKISKWIKDLKKAAFYDVANNATTATAGTSVLDAYQGKLLKEQLDEQNTNITKNTLGVGVDLKSYTNSYYTFPSDGYVYLLLSYTANQYVYAEISGKTGSSFYIQVSTGGDGHFGNTAIPVFVRKGMVFKIGMYSDLQYVTATFLPLI
ncbi:MAG: BppU family phage baseplate upper protein [Lachnoclostridium sp.]|nr:BppU family phage baseplate upper protein [Lachnoclostridium sp.]